jgi:hypothetical protein
MNAREIGLKQAEAAYIAEISERTGQRIEAGEHQPNRGKVKKQTLTQDPLGEVWEQELEPMLKKEPRLKPMTLFEYLQDTYPGKYPQVLLRTLQRRVQTWKALHGASPEVMFELRHEPGLIGFSDFTQLKGIEITITYGRLRQRRSTIRPSAIPLSTGLQRLAIRPHHPGWGELHRPGRRTTERSSSLWRSTQTTPHR